MTVEILYLKDEHIINGNDMTLEQRGMLEACLTKIKESSSISELACQPEVYKELYLYARDLENETLRFRLCTVRINAEARLFYTTYQNKFIPLDACWDHKLDDFHLVKNQAIRNSLAMEIIQKLSVSQQQNSPPTETPASTTNQSNWPTGTTKKISSKKIIITLTDEQESIVHRALEAPANLCFGPPGTGKTEVAKIVIKRLFEGLEARYFTLGSRLCNQVREELSDSASLFRCETWDELHASLIEVFEEIKIHLFERCRVEQESKSQDSGAAKKSKSKTAPTNAIKSEYEKLLEELEEILTNSNLEIADINHFISWFKANRQMKYSQDKNLSLSYFDESLLFAEFTRIIIQQGSDLSRAYLKIEDYLALGERQSYIRNTPNSLRRFAYECFEKYISSLKKSNLYEPHIHMHSTFQFIHKIQKSTLSPNVIQKAVSEEGDQPNGSNDFFSELRTDILILDEAQQMPIWLLHILMALQPRGLYLFADPHQIMGPQATRVIEPLRKMLHTHLMTQNTYALNRNFRNAKLIGDIANTLLHFERRIYGSSEREAEFLLDCKHTEHPGIVDCKPDNANNPRDEIGNHQAVVIVPEQFVINDAFRERWGNNVLYISDVGGLEWHSVTLVGFSDRYRKELKELSNMLATYPLQVPIENTAFARKKEPQEALPSLAARDVLHRLYTITTRAKYEFHLVDEHRFLNELIGVIVPNTALSVPESPEHSIKKPKSTPLEWIALARQYFEEETSFETATNILWGSEIWGGTLKPKIKEFLSSLESKISICNLVQSLFELPETERMNWLKKILSHSNIEENSEIVEYILKKNPLALYINNQTQKTLKIVSAKENSAVSNQSNPDNSAVAASKDPLPIPRNNAPMPFNLILALRERQRLNQLLYLEAAKGNIRAVRELLAKGANINAREDKNGYAPLLIAAKNGRVNVVSLLVDQENTNVNQTDFGGKTALTLAVLYGHLDIVNLLLSRPYVDVNLPMDMGATPFYVAMQEGNIDIIQAFLKRPDIDYKKCANDGVSPFHIAVDKERLKAVEALIDLDEENVCKPVQDGTNPLHIAAYKGNLAILEILIKKLSSLNVDLNLKIASGATALFLAAQQGHTEVVKCLKMHGAAINQSNYIKETPLIAATYNGHIETVKLLLEYPDINVDLAQHENQTPLFIATALRKTSIVRALLHKGANPNIAENQNNFTPLGQAAFHGHIEIGFALLKHGAKINQRDHNGATALFIAATHDRQEFAIFLLDNGADVNQALFCGLTPMLSALNHGHYSMVELLKKRGAIDKPLEFKRQA